MDKINQNSSRGMEHSPKIKGAMMNKFQKKVLEDQGYQVPIPGSQGGAAKILNPAQVVFAPGHQGGYKKTPTGNPLNVGGGLGGNGFSLPQTQGPVADSLGATRPQDGQMPVNFGAEPINSERELRFNSEFGNSGPSGPQRSLHSRGLGSGNNSSSKRTTDKSTRHN